MHLSLEQEVWGSNLWLIKLDTELSAGCHCWDISPKGAVLTECMMQKWALQTRDTSWCSTASIMKDLIGLEF